MAAPRPHAARRRRPPHFALAIAVATGLAASGCGNNESEGSDSAPGQPARRNVATVTDDEIARALKLRTVSQPEVSLSVEVTPSGCAVSEIYNRKQEVDLYSGAGGQVVTSPSGTIGVEPGAGVSTVDGSEPRIQGVLVKPGDTPACLAELERALAVFG